MKIAIGSDHGGFDMKEAVIAHLKDAGHEVTDLGCYDKNSCDYPQYGKAVAKAVTDGTCQRGIVICTTGIGISIAANKVPGIRCGLCSDTTAAFLTRSHNDANVLAMGGGMIGMNVAIDIVDTFLSTEFCGLEKHARRIAAIE
ncbi:MAG: ribose 5-phosphate isomerase B [Lachnospiraceae bacterium]|nr:ribose 5-phosphate isomerase B [Lachnospiraceae bacterium]